MFLEEHEVFMGLSGYVLRYCWGETRFPWRVHPAEGAELCQWALTHNGVVKGESNKFVQWNKEIKLWFWQEMTTWKDFYALPSLPVSAELRMLKLARVSVTALGATKKLLWPKSTEDTEQSHRAAQQWEIGNQTLALAMAPIPYVQTMVSSRLLFPSAINASPQGTLATTMRRS